MLKRTSLSISIRVWLVLILNVLVLLAASGFTTTSMASSHTVPSINPAQAQDLYMTKQSSSICTLTNSNWSGWKEVYGSGTTDQALAATSDGIELYLYMKGMNDRVYINTCFQEQWSGWKEVYGSGTTDRALAALARGSAPQYLFMKGMNDRVYVNILNQLA
jgi:hypothetical protein